MPTQVYRISRVLTAAGSPVARLQARNEEGHEVGLELPAVLVERTAPGHVLVLTWSIHALPEPLAPAPVAADDVPPVSATSPRAVDEAFMGLMTRGQRSTAAGATPPTSTASPASRTRSEPEINDDFNKLLGTPRTKGQER